MVGSVNDWQKERQFQVLSDKKEERGVKVIRNGLRYQSLSLHHPIKCSITVVCLQDVVVGDISLLELG